MPRLLFAIFSWLPALPTLAIPPPAGQGAEGHPDVALRSSDEGNELRSSDEG